MAVLNQNLIKSKELFNLIQKSLNNISVKSSTASAKIKPVLREVNQLNYNKTQIDQGLGLLEEVSAYAAKTATYESILNQSIDLIGLKKFVDTLTKSKKLLVEMKSKIKNFRGILINFENLIDKSQLVLINYFGKLLNNSGKGVLAEKSTKKTQDMYLVLNYFYLKLAGDRGMINGILTRNLGLQLVEQNAGNGKLCKPQKRGANVPYERGTNGINGFNNQVIRSVKAVSGILDDMSQSVALDMNQRGDLLRDILDPYINSEYTRVLQYYVQFFRVEGELIASDVLVLEVLENLNHFEKFLNVNNMDMRQFKTFYATYQEFLGLLQELFLQLVRFVEARVTLVDRFTDQNIPEIIVELISRIRRISEFDTVLLSLIKDVKLGLWLNIKPPVRFIGVYTSVMPNDNEDDRSETYLLLSYFSDLLDQITVNIEINLKQNSSDTNLKKSVQGYYLIKNVILIETIINRSEKLFGCLGPIGMERLNKLKNRFLKLFLDDWNYASYIIIRDMTNITTTNALHQSSGSGVSLKEKEQIKELFKNFNELFEEALRNYERFNITDTNLRNYLLGEIKKLILNAYFKLYDKYGKSDFTKNKAKYVKYDRGQFEALLNQKL